MVGRGDSEGCEGGREWVFVVESTKVGCIASHRIQAIGAYILDGWLRKMLGDKNYHCTDLRSLSCQQETSSRDIIHSRFQELKQSKTTRQKRHPCFISSCLSAKDCFVSRERERKELWVWVSGGKGCLVCEDGLDKVWEVMCQFTQFKGGGKFGGHSIPT